MCTTESIGVERPYKLTPVFFFTFRFDSKTSRYCSAGAAVPVASHCGLTSSASPVVTKRLAYTTTPYKGQSDKAHQQPTHDAESDGGHNPCTTKGDHTTPHHRSLRHATRSKPSRSRSTGDTCSGCSLRLTLTQALLRTNASIHTAVQYYRGVGLFPCSILFARSLPDA